MKVHPSPRKLNITLRYDIVSSLPQANSSLLLCRQTKLRRLPHIFAKVLELPFRSDAEVFIEETPDSLRFTVDTDDVGHDVRAHTIEIYPGVTKIVIRGGNVGDDVSLVNEFEFELDLWRFRLPGSVRPEMASAVYGDGELIVTVPKGGDLEEEDGGVGNEGIGAGGRVVLVQ